MRSFWREVVRWFRTPGDEWEPTRSQRRSLIRWNNVVMVSFVVVLSIALIVQATR